MSEKTITCPNTSCKKTFKSLLSVSNVTANSRFYACPSCLTEIPFVNTEIKAKPKAKDSGDSSPEVEDVKEMQKDPKCSYYKGYLHEKDNRSHIPEECLLCTEIIDCMYQKRAQ